jgi:hypothetical protein
MVYQNIPSALRPVELDNSLPIPKPPQQWTIHKEVQTSTSSEDKPGPSGSNVDPDFPVLTVVHLVSQSDFNDLVRDLNLSKIQAGLLASRVQGWNLIQQGVKVSYRKRQQLLSLFLSRDDELVYYNDVEGLLQEVGCIHNPEECSFLHICLNLISRWCCYIPEIFTRRYRLPDCPLCPHEGNLGEYGFALVSYKLYKIWMEYMRRPQKS